MWGFLGYLAGAVAELFDGTLKLRFCTTSFTKRFLPPLPKSILRNGAWAGGRDGVASSQLLDDGGNKTKRVWLTRKTCPGTHVHFRPDPGLPTPTRWERLALPDSSGAGEEVGVPRDLFSHAWNLHPQATGVGLLSGWSDQLKERVRLHRPFFIVHSARAWTDTHA